VSATDRWREQLEAWAIPQHLLDAVSDSPYEWPPELWKRRTAAAEEGPESATTGILRRLLPVGGSLLDVGAGTGRASLPVAGEGHPLTAVERNPGMAGGLREEAARRGIDVAVIEGSWPDVARQAGRHDIAMCAHVVYDVQDIAPFVAALDDAARRAVVIELTPRHPWHGLAPYYRAMHNLDRPGGPTAGDLAGVVSEQLAVRPNVEEWTRPGGLRFASIDEMVEFQRRRLVLPKDRAGELEGLLTPDIVQDGDWFLLGPAERTLVTLWWEAA
jgi:SAM-dependent methyltransferase